jgi:hypothetical protein
MIRFVFDMDGTIVDSRRAVREAYRRAGHPLPDDAWGKTAGEWGCPPDVHKMKIALYPTLLLRMGRRMHASDLLETVNGEVLTGATLQAVQAVRKFLKNEFRLLGAGCSHEAKIEILQVQSYPGSQIIYVDDDFDFGQRAMQEVQGLLFLHVARHEGVFHLHSKKGAQRWTLSSWLPDVTIV